MPETPLGQVVSIRAETDKDILKNFTEEQHRIRNEWRNRIPKAVIFDEATTRKQLKMIQEAMKAAFGR